MAFNSAIEWTDATWNPWHGCHKVSAGCKNCYMFRDKARYGQDPNVVKRAADKTFYAPLKWAEPKKIFTCSWSDFFIEESDAWRDEAFAIMALTPHHTYQVLTKRPDRMLEYFNFYNVGRDHNRADYVADAVAKLLGRPGAKGAERTEGIDFDWPLKNVWLGISVEDQERADERIPLLLQTPAAKRFISAEPLLGPVDLNDIHEDGECIDADYLDQGLIEWVIAGGESGLGARRLYVPRVRSIVEQCKAAGVSVFVKQLGAFVVDRNDAGFDADWHDGEGWPDGIEPEFNINGFREDHQGADVRIRLTNKKGGDMSEWPSDLRVRQFPEVSNAN